MAQRETFRAFDDDDNGSHGIVRVQDLEYLTQQSLSEFVEAQAELMCAECVNSSRGDCGLMGYVDRGSRLDDVPTGMGGYMEGSVEYVTVSTYCTADNCPSSAPAQRLAQRLARFHSLAMGGVRAVQEETARSVREAESEASAIVKKARDAANIKILEPAEKQAAALIEQAKADVEAHIEGDKARASEITDAVYTQRRDVRLRELARITNEATVEAPTTSGKLF